MKKSIVFLLMMAVVWIYVAINLRLPEKVILGEASESMQNVYLQARVGAVKAHGFSIYADGVDISSETCYISEAMHLMMPIRDCAELFDCTVTFIDETNARINGIDVMDALNSDDGDKAEDVYVDLQTASEAMGIWVTWDDDNYCFNIETANDVILPTSYDVRNERALNSIEDQGSQGTCWAFASTAALELSSGDPTEDYSVDHITMNSGYNISPDAGGDTLMSMAYFLSWKGPVYEWEDPYGDGVTDVSLQAVKHLQEAIILTDGDRDKVKRAVMEYGGVESSLYMSISTEGESSEDYNPYTAAYYYNGDMQPNHDIVIIGWDDDYSRENFSRQPEYDGAFICRNSWGESFGDEGYFYVSYADANLGNYNVVYTKVEAADNYDYNYQTDLLGWIGSMGFSSSEAWFANVYRADSAQQIQAVGFYAVDADTTFDIYLVKGSALETELSDTAMQDAVYVGSGKVKERGYYTVTFPEGVDVNEAERFAAVIRIHTENSTRPVAIEYAAGDFSSTADLTDGEGYISFNGNAWSRTETEYQCNICLKIYTEENNE